MAEESQRTTQQAGLLQKGLSVIETLIAARLPLSLTGVAEATGMDASSAHRILKILVAERYALRDARTKRYVPGPKAMYPLGLYHPLNVARRDALPMIQSLCEETGQTAAMVVFINEERIALEVILGRNRLTPFFEAHVRRPLHSSASGKLLLMAMSPEQRRRVLGAPPYPSFTPHTITQPERLEEDLLRASERGYAIALDESFMGLAAVAAPIRSASSTVLGCFAIFSTSEGMTDARMAELGERLLRAAQLFTYMSPSLEGLESIIGVAREPRKGLR